TAPNLLRRTRLTSSYHTPPTGLGDQLRVSRLGWVPTVILVRHGRTDANASGTLAGHTPGVRLDDAGQAQAGALADRLSAVPLAASVSSPPERCYETATAIAQRRPGMAITTDDRLIECRYGDWTGRPLR